MSAPTDDDDFRLEVEAAEVTNSGKLIPRPKRLKLDPCLTDGTNYAIHDKVDASLMGLLRAWLDEGQEGESITIEIVRMTDYEAEELPSL